MASLFELLEFVICEMSFPAPASVLFTCEWSVYSIDTNNLYAKLICSARENIFRRLCWIWEPVKLIILAFSYRIVDCSILVPCSPSIDVFLSRERKFNPFLLLLWGSRRCREETRNMIPEDLCRKQEENAQRRWKSAIGCHTLRNSRFSWLLIPQALSCLLVVGIVDDAALRQHHTGSSKNTEEVAWYVINEQSSSYTKMTVLIVAFFHRSVRINDSLLLVKAFCQLFPPWNWNNPINDAERKCFTKEWKMYPFWILVKKKSLRCASIFLKLSSDKA